MLNKWLLTEGQGKVLQFWNVPEVYLKTVYNLKGVCIEWLYETNSEF